MTRLPMLWAALAALVVATVIGTVYTLGHVGVGDTADKFVVKVAFEDAAGLDPADRPLAAVAGTRQGRVEEVRRENGRTIVTLKLDARVRGKVFSDAAATIRPAGAVPVLSVDIDPGTPGRPGLEDGATIPESRSSTYVAPDKVLDVLDSDTRTHLQILLGEADTALEGRGGDLAEAAVAAAPLAETAAEVTGTIAERRRLVRRMVGDLATAARTLRERRETLVSAIDAGRTVLATTGGRSGEIEQAVQELPALLDETDAALTEIRAVAGPLKAGLRASGPLLDELPESLRELRTMEPGTRALIRELARLEKLGAEQIPAIRRFSARLPQAATAGRPSVNAAAKTIATLSEYGAGLAQLGDLISGAVSTNDSNGVLARAIFSSIEPIKPENFGFEAQRKSLNLNRRSLYPMLAAALEHRCETDTAACLMRLTAPGLPPVKGAR